MANTGQSTRTRRLTRLNGVDEDWDIISLYEGTEDVRWFYLGLEGFACCTSGVYRRWKNEYLG